MISMDTKQSKEKVPTSFLLLKKQVQKDSTFTATRKGFLAWKG